jgi:hypothetical protein
MVVCVRPLFLARGGCIVGSVHTLGDIRTEGDLIVAGELHCEGNLAARSFVRARTFKLKGTGAVDGGMETVEEFNVAGRMRHKGALEIKAAFAAKPTNPHGHWLWGFFICSSFGGFFSMQLSMT